jgi:hypothetical protein
MSSLSSIGIGISISIIHIPHGHDFDHQTSPAGKMLRALTLSTLRIILFLSKARLFPVGNWDFVLFVYAL